MIGFVINSVGFFLTPLVAQFSMEPVTEKGKDYIARYGTGYIEKCNPYVGDYETG